MLLKELKLNDILERYHNQEYIDSRIIEDYILNSQTDFELLLLKLQYDELKDNISSEMKETLDEKVKEVDLTKRVKFENADDFALVLRTGVNLIDESGKIYFYDSALLNPYRVEEELESDESVAITDWFILCVDTFEIKEIR